MPASGKYTLFGFEMDTSQPSSSSWSDGTFGMQSAYPVPARRLRRPRGMVDRLKRWGASVDAWLQQRRSTRVLRRAAIGFVQHGSLQYPRTLGYFSNLSLCHT